MTWITRKVKTLAAKYRNRYGSKLGVILAVGVLAALPIPLPGISLGVQGLGEVLRLCGVRF